MAIIATRWHTFEEAVFDGNIRLVGLAPGATRLQVPNSQTLDLEKFVSLIHGMADLPRFVVEPDVVDLMDTHQAALSIGDMVTCNVLNLPYKECVFEYETEGTTYIVRLSESEVSDGRLSWDALALAYNGHSKNALVFPAALRLQVEAGDEDDISEEMNSSVYPKIYAGALPAPYMRDGSQLHGLIEDAQPLMVTRCFTAFVAAVLLPQTIGLRREQSKITASFNRARADKGRSAIPDHTIIRLGAVAPARGMTSPVDRSCVEVHLRRAHKKRVAFGPGKAQRAWRFIPAQVVGYLPDGRKPTMPEMLATRAAKPYLLHGQANGIVPAAASFH